MDLVPPTQCHSVSVSHPQNVIQMPERCAGGCMMDAGKDSVCVILGNRSRMRMAYVGHVSSFLVIISLYFV